MDGQRDKAPPHLPAAASSSPRQAVEHTREVTSRARPAGRRPPSGTAGGVGHPRLATPSAARLPRCGQSQQQGWGPLALPPPVASFIFIIFMRGWGRGPACPRRPAPDLGSRPGGGTGPSGAPPASASGREFPLGHDSKMCRGRSSVGRPCPRVCLWGLLLARKGAKRPGKGLLLSLGKGR